MLERSSRIKGGRKGLLFCNACRKQFSVTVGTVFERSHVSLHTWLYATHLLCSSKKGISSHQLSRMLGVSYKTAWFMSHRIREAMKDKDFPPLTGIVEADETYIGGKPRGTRKQRIQRHPTMSARIRAAWDKKEPVLGIVERGGRVRTVHIGKLSQRKVQDKLVATIDTERAALMTDEHNYYHGIGRTLPHGVIRHKSEYVRGAVHTQNIESYWANLKRGLFGIYHHVDAGYLGCYLSEFDFRFNRRGAVRFFGAAGFREARPLVLPD